MVNDWVNDLLAAEFNKKYHLLDGPPSPGHSFFVPGPQGMGSTVQLLMADG
jgi:hypothetical protein